MNPEAAEVTSEMNLESTHAADQQYAHQGVPGGGEVGIISICARPGFSQQSWSLAAQFTEMKICI